MEVARWLLEQDLSLLDQSDDQGWTVLHMGAMFASRECLKLVCNLGLPIDGKDSIGRTALMLACCVGSVAAVALLMKSGAALLAVDSLGRSAAHYAAQSGNVELIKQICRDPNARDASGTTVLQVACLSGSAGAIEALLSLPSANTQLLDNASASLIHYAAASPSISGLFCVCSFAVVVVVCSRLLFWKWPLFPTWFPRARTLFLHPTQRETRCFTLLRIKGTKRLFAFC